MTIRRGEAWGEAVSSPPDLHLAPDDRTAGAWVIRHREQRTDLPPVGLLGGDLARTLGGGAEGRFPGVVSRAPVDIVRVEADGVTTWGLAHVVARRSWWWGEIAIAMNAQYLDGRDAAPRSHPNDGAVDLLLVRTAMSFRARWQARRRSRTGTHVPHPDITVGRAATAEWKFTRPLVVRVDGVRWRTCRELRLTVEPDALIVYA